MFIVFPRRRSITAQPLTACIIAALTAATGDFIEMVRTSLHLLLGTLAIRRGAIVECPPHLELTNPLALWGLGADYDGRFVIDEAIRKAFLGSDKGAFEVDETVTIEEPELKSFLAEHRPEYRAQLIELIVPMIVRGNLTGLVLLGGKAEGRPWTIVAVGAGSTPNRRQPRM